MDRRFHGGAKKGFVERHKGLLANLSLLLAILFEALDFLIYLSDQEKQDGSGSSDNGDTSEKTIVAPILLALVLFFALPAAELIRTYASGIREKGTSLEYQAFFSIFLILQVIVVLAMLIVWCALLYAYIEESEQLNTFIIVLLSIALLLHLIIFVVGRILKHIKDKRAPSRSSSIENLQAGSGGRSSQEGRRFSLQPIIATLCCFAMLCIIGELASAAFQYKDEQEWNLWYGVSYSLHAIAFACWTVLDRKHAHKNFPQSGLLNLEEQKTADRLFAVTAWQRLAFLLVLVAFFVQMGVSGQGGAGTQWFITLVVILLVLAFCFVGISLILFLDEEKLEEAPR